ncbi:hypothetical protein [Marinagarivorans algicola]|uniref:hypothetical protein n=1 Tax=Marinagarivorans algicola TaxID=1513270 RepID=UPI0006B88075|nr:hypothetical protein [Marinagarivorans algicola]
MTVNCRGAAWVTTALASCLLSSAAFAGGYMGVSVGESRIELGKPSFDTNFDAKKIDLKDSDIGMKVFGGYRFTIIAVEAAYVDLGKIEGAQGTFAEASGFSGFGMLHLPLGPASVFGKVGGFIWQNEASLGQLVDEDNKFKDDGYDLAYGVGVMFGLLDIDARLEYEYFNVGKFEDVSLVSVGVSYTF